MPQRLFRLTAARCVLAASALVLAGTGAHAQPAPAGRAAADVTDGRALAEVYCARCHVVARNVQGGWNAAPPFDAIANSENTNAARLIAFIQKPHMQMLETGRPIGEARALAAYIMSLRKG
jgi:mono/diheme cytochrome c family protein